MTIQRTHERARWDDRHHVVTMRPVARVLALAALCLTLAACSSGFKDATSAANSGGTTADATTTPTNAPTAATEPSANDAATTDSTGSAGDPTSASTALADGPVTVVALGDSLTAGEGDDAGQGFVGLLTMAIDAAPGRSGSSLSNYGVSGWLSAGVVDGQDGAGPQVAPAVDDVKANVAAGRAVLATILIGSNDLWYLYDGAGDEDAAADTYRSNLDRIVGDLTQAGAFVLVGLPDDQSMRPISSDLDLLHTYFPNITAQDIQAMSAMAGRFDGIAQDVASKYGARTVDTNSPFWSDTATMNEDLVHPNGAGYAILAKLWIDAIRDLL